jgi:hypothetical protein
MNKPTTLYRKPSFIAITAMSILITVISVSAWTSSRSRRQDTTPKVVNKTQALQVTKSERKEGKVLLSLRNNHFQKIKAIAISSGEITLRRDFIYSDEGIDVGADYEIDIPYKDQTQINVLAVIFDNREGDGDANTIKEIKETRLGEKKQLKRIIPILQAIVNSYDAETSAGIDKAIAEISATTDLSEVDTSTEAKDGARGRKEAVIRKMKSLKDRLKQNNNTNSREELIKLKEYYEQLAARL